MSDPCMHDFSAPVRGRRGSVATCLKCGVTRQSDHQGYTNWETFNTKLMMDNEEETHRAVRDLAAQGATPEQIRDWALHHIIGPHNKDAIADAQRWNDIPEHDRLDHHWEELKDKSPGAADLVNSLGFGEDVSDVEPTLIDPELVNWNEIHQDLANGREEEAKYDRQEQEQQAAGLDYRRPGHGNEFNTMYDAYIKHLGQQPGPEELNPYAWAPGDLLADHNGAQAEVTGPMRNEYLPMRHIAPGEKYHLNDFSLHPRALGNYGYRRVRGQGQEPMNENLEHRPGLQPIDQLNPNDYTDDMWQNKVIPQGGAYTNLGIQAADAIGALRRGQASPQQQANMQAALEARGHEPAAIGQMMGQRWEWDPEQSKYVDLNPQPPASPDPALDQPGHLTFPPDWSEG